METKFEVNKTHQDTSFSDLQTNMESDHLCFGNSLPKLGIWDRFSIICLPIGSTIYKINWWMCHRLWGLPGVGVACNFLGMVQFFKQSGIHFACKQKHSSRAGIWSMPALAFIVWEHCLGHSYLFVHRRGICRNHTECTVGSLKSCTNGFCFLSYCLTGSCTSATLPVLVPSASR